MSTNCKRDQQFCFMQCSAFFLAASSSRTYDLWQNGSLMVMCVWIWLQGWLLQSRCYCPVIADHGDVATAVSEHLEFSPWFKAWCNVIVVIIILVVLILILVLMSSEALVSVVSTVSSPLECVVIAYIYVSLKAFLPSNSLWLLCHWFPRFSLSDF